MILAERQSASSLCWHAAGRGCRHRAARTAPGCPTRPGERVCVQRGRAMPPVSRLRPIPRAKEQGQLFGNPMDES